MKNYYTILLLLSVLLGACGGGNSQKDTPEETPEETPKEMTLEDDSSLILGKELIEKSDCSGCHKQQDKLVGPSYKEISLKYQNESDASSMLVEKIITGGKGTWGEIPMTAHPQISQADAEEMVKYILSVKNIQ